VLEHVDKFQCNSPELNFTKTRSGASQMFGDKRTDMANPVAVRALQFFSMNARKKKHLFLTMQLSNVQNKELGYYRRSCQVVWITTGSVVKSFLSLLKSIQTLFDVWHTKALRSIVHATWRWRHVSYTLVLTRESMYHPQVTNQGDFTRADVISLLWLALYSDCTDRSDIRASKFQLRSHST